MSGRVDGTDCELYDDGLIYDSVLPGGTDDLPFYLSQLEGRSGSVLELGCGTGRLAVPMAAKGLQVTGLDASESMLGRAAQKAAEAGVSVEWVRADMTRFDLRRQFALILLPANAIAHLHDLEAILGCFRCVRGHMATDGRFVLVMFNPRLDVFLRDPSQRYPVSSYDDPHGRGPVTVTENNVYDRAAQVNHIKWYFRYEETGQETIVDLDMRIFYPQELDALLRLSGFEIERKCGSFDGQPFASDSPMQVYVCRRA